MLILPVKYSFAGVVSEKFNNNELKFSNILVLENLDTKTNKQINSYLKILDNIYKSNSGECSNSVIASASNDLKNSARGLEDELYMILGYAYELCKDTNKSLDFYKKSKSARNKNPVVDFKIGLIECNLKNYSSCKNLLNESEWQGLNDQHILQYNKALILALEKKYPEALEVAEKSINTNNKFLLTAKLIYFIKLDLVSSTKNKELKNKLQNDLHNDIGRIYLLNPGETSYGIQYAKNLLATGDLIKSQNRLIQGKTIIEKLINEKPNNLNELFLIKIQFLEKLQKNEELEDFLNTLKKNKNLSPELKAKINMFNNESSDN